MTALWLCAIYLELSFLVALYVGPAIHNSSDE